jgi:hypothetical protein
MLAVDVDQVLARFAQLLHRGTAAIDKAARTAVGIQRAAQQTSAFVAFQLLFTQPGLQLRQR